MTPWQQLELCINKIEAQAETTAILIKEAQSAAATALAYAIAKGVIQGDWKILDTKQQIKDLMLELIGEDEEPVYGIATLEDKARITGDVTSVKNSFKAELRQKVAEL